MIDYSTVRDYGDDTAHADISRQLPPNFAGEGDGFVQAARFIENDLAACHASARFIFSVTDRIKVHFDGKAHFITISCNGARSDIAKLNSCLDRMCHSTGIPTNTVHVPRVELPVVIGNKSRRKTLRDLVKERRTAPMAVEPVLTGKIMDGDTL